jgi:hypothetical protein
MSTHLKRLPGIAPRVQGLESLVGRKPRRAEDRAGFCKENRAGFEPHRGYGFIHRAAWFTDWVRYHQG